MRKLLVLFAAMFSTVAMAFPVTVSMYSDGTCTNFYGYAHSAASIAYYMSIGQVGSYRIMNGSVPGCRWCRHTPPDPNEDCMQDILPSY